MTAVVMVGECASLMAARLDAGLRAVPAHVFTLVFIGETLGANHHSVADSQRAVVVTIFTRTDGAHAGLVASCLGNDGSAGDGHLSTLAFLTAADACTIVLALGINIAARNLDGTAVTILTATNTCSIRAAVGIDRAAGDGHGVTCETLVKNTFAATTDAGTVITAIGMDFASGN